MPSEWEELAICGKKLGVKSMKARRYQEARNHTSTHSRLRNRNPFCWTFDVTLISVLGEVELGL